MIEKHKKHTPQELNQSRQRQDNCPDLITIKEAAATLNVTERTISRLIQQQELQSLKVDSRRLIWRESVLKMSSSDPDQVRTKSEHFRKEVLESLNSIYDAIQRLADSQTAATNK